MEREKVSIIIVSMNRMDNLDRCLPSIERFTSTPHQVYVVAYLFSDENLAALRERYPYVKIIISKEIRGFSENNNLALRQVTTPYVFIQNDDTEYREPVLDRLLHSLENTPDATVMSPVLRYDDGSIQHNGRGKFTFADFIRCNIGLAARQWPQYTNGKGIYMSWNVSGAAFLIGTHVFRKIGFFDERYFFCPEDIAVGETLNSQGKHCYVDTNANIIHYEGVSSKKGKLFYATTSAAYLGNLYFFGDTKWHRLAVKLLYKYKYWQHKLANKIKSSEHHRDYLYIYDRVCYAISNHKTPKELFIEEYQKIVS